MPPPELFTADLEEEIEQLRTEFIRQRLEGELNMRIGRVEQGKRKIWKVMRGNGCTSNLGFIFKDQAER